MLSTCLALSLTLAGCGGTGQDETHQEIAAAPITVDGPSITSEAAFIFDQKPGETPDILDSAPKDEFANDLAWAMERIGKPTAGLMDLASGMLVASAEAATANDADHPDAVHGTLQPKHPRPTNLHRLNDPNLPEWARDWDKPSRNERPAQNSDASQPKPSAGNSPANGNPGSNSASNNSAASQNPSAARDRLVSVTSDGYRLNSPEFNRLYGPGVFNQYALANTIVGSYRNLETVVSNRFMALNSGYLASVKLYWQTGLGYAGGTGGTIRLRIFPDDGSSAHLPDMKGEPLAQAVYRPGLKPGEDKKSIFQDIPVSRGNQPLQAGRIYHLVMDNIDAHPNDNFISSNNAITYIGTGRPARWLNTLDWSTLLAKRPRGSRNAYTWLNLTEKGTTNNYFSPILQLTMTNGQIQGVSDMEGGSVDPKTIFTATQATPVRERFTPGSDKTISGISFSTAASVGGRLEWRILQGQTVLANGTIEALRPNYHLIRTNTSLSMGGTTWYDIALPKDIRLRAGQTYDLEFRPQGSSQWKFGGHRNGSSYGFRWPAAFTESQAQHFQNGSWLDTYHWSYTQSRRGSNWPVVLHLAP